MNKFDCPTCRVTSPEPVLEVDEAIDNKYKEALKRWRENRPALERAENKREAAWDLYQLAKKGNLGEKAISFFLGKYKEAKSECWGINSLAPIPYHFPSNYIQCPVCNNKHYFMEKN